MHSNNDSIDTVLEKNNNSKSWKRFFSKRNIIILILALTIPFGVGYLWQTTQGDASTTTETKTYTVKKGNLSTTISSDGNVVAEDGVTVSFSTTGVNITEVYVKQGETVKAGDKLAKIDTTDMEFDLKSAQNSLTSAYANYNSTVAGATDTEIAISQKSVDSAQASLEKVRSDNATSIKQSELKLTNLQKDLASIQTGDSTNDSNIEAIEESYTSAILKADSISLDVKSALKVAEDILDDDNSFYYSLGATDQTTFHQAENSYSSLVTQYQNYITTYGSLKSVSDTDKVIAKIDAMLDISQAMEKMLKLLYTTLENTVASTNLTESAIASYQSSVSSQQSKMKSAEESITSTKQNINSALLNKNDKKTSLEEDIEDAEISLADTKKKAASSEQSAVNSLEVAQLNYLKLTEPTSDVDLATLRAQINSAKISLDKVKYKIEQATLTAPINGEIVELDGQVGDRIIQDNNENFCTILNKDTFFVSVSIEEAEINQILKGQKVIVTFDAIPDTEVEGEVSFISLTSSTDSSGIVTYPVKILLKDWSDVPIKEGMTAYVDFVIGEANDVLIVPTAAVAKNGDKNIVVMENGESREVVTGFTDGTNVAITSGLDEGDIIVANASAATSSEKTGSAAAASASGNGVFTEEEIAKLKTMTEEERAAFLKEKGLTTTTTEGGGGGGGGMGGPPPG